MAAGDETSWRHNVSSKNEGEGFRIGGPGIPGLGEAWHSLILKQEVCMLKNNATSRPCDDYSQK